MNFIQKIISYLYPIKVKEISSQRSGSLEVTLVNGKLVIDSENANYSYGSLQQVLKKGLIHIGLDNLQKSENILVLGVAGGSVIKTLRNDFNIEAKITGVEIDPDIIELANTYFKLNSISNLELVIEDAFQFIKTTQETYDLIIIDIFNDSNMPNELFEDSFWITIEQLLKNKGFCLFNSIYTSKKDMNRNQQLNTLLENLFKFSKQLKTHRINELFILEK
ncbi:MAG: fused MFS/spermidine synthase [Flavobacteriaceae bacterium]|nr:fused MFS/spermidine synthase [Flavobacteriaceae bacterium]